jgi:ParB-like chromosome segregation protein Spo0J
MSVFSVEFGKRTGYALNPALIKLPDHSLQGRFGIKPKAVEEMAESLLTEGQKQNVIVRKDNENAPVLVAGFRRRAAALLINEKRNDKNFRAKLSEAAIAKLDAMGDEPFVLEAKLESINEKAAFLSNVTENVGRIELSPMDRLKIIMVLRDTFKMKDAEIAAVFGKKPWYVYHHLKLSELSTRIQELVDAGVISLEVAAKTLVKVPESERETMVDAIVAEHAQSQAENEAMAEEGTIDPATLKRITGAVLAKHERERRSKTGEDGSKIKRTLADLKKFSRNYVESHSADEDPTSALLVDFMAFLEGGISEATLVRRIKKHLGIETGKKAATAATSAK